MVFFARKTRLSSLRPVPNNWGYIIISYIDKDIKLADEVTKDDENFYQAVVLTFCFVPLLAAFTFTFYHNKLYIGIYKSLYKAYLCTFDECRELFGDTSFGISDWGSCYETFISSTLWKKNKRNHMMKMIFIHIKYW